MSSFIVHVGGDNFLESEAWRINFYYTMFVMGHG